MVAILTMTSTLLAGCASESLPVSTGSWQVVALLYSGRENPHGQLSPQEAGAFEAMVAELPAGTVSERGGLGYQGFMVRRQGTVGTNGIRELIVYDGIVEVFHTNGIYYLADPERTLERWLLVSAGEWLPDEERLLVENEVE
jgi:hypothetical protein